MATRKAPKKPKKQKPRLVESRSNLLTFRFCSSTVERHFLPPLMYLLFKITTRKTNNCHFVLLDELFTFLKTIKSRVSGPQPFIIFCSLLLATSFTLILTLWPVLKNEEFAVIYHCPESQGFLIRSGLFQLFKEDDRIFGYPC